MKVKTSVMLSEELLEAISAATEAENRSAFIEAAAWEYINKQMRGQRDRREIERINTNASYLNEEARDASDFQEDE